MIIRLDGGPPLRSRDYSITYHRAVHGFDLTVTVEERHTHPSYPAVADLDGVRYEGVARVVGGVRLENGRERTTLTVGLEPPAH